MENEKQILFATRLRTKMELCKLKKKDVISHFGKHENGEYQLSSNTLDNWLRKGKGGNMPTLDKIIELAKLLNTSVDYLCGISPIDSSSINLAEMENRLGLTVNAIQELIFKATNAGNLLSLEHPTRSRVSCIDFQHELKAIDFLICNGYDFLQALYAYTFASDLSQAHMVVTRHDKRNEYIEFPADDFSDVLLMKLMRLLLKLRDINISSLPELPKSYYIK